MEIKYYCARFLSYMISFLSLIYLLRNKFAARVPCGRVRLTKVEACGIFNNGLYYMNFIGTVVLWK